jgi:putative flippase GtrA
VQKILGMRFHSSYINPSWVKFLLNGVFITIFTYAIYVLFLLVVSFELAFTISFLLGIIISYLTNSKIIFRANSSFSSFMRFIFLAVSIFSVSIIGLRFLVNDLNIPNLAAPILTSFLVAPINFFITRKIFTLK